METFPISMKSNAQAQPANGMFGSMVQKRLPCGKSFHMEHPQFDQLFKPHIRIQI